MSVAGDIADAVVTAVRGLSLVPSASVVRRKTPSLPQGVDPPQIVVSVGEENEITPLTSTKDRVRYPVSVTIVTGGGKKLADDDTVREWRESIRVAVNRRATFSGVSEFNQVDPGGKRPFDPGAMAKDLNYSVLTFTVTTREARN
jgi:hypothetical protein